jgi:ferredoxin-NADP reductase
LDGARNGPEHPFGAGEFSDARAVAGQSLSVFFSSPASGDRVGADYDVRGRLSAVTVRRLDLPDDGDAYLCGPATFMEELRAALVARGLAATRVHTETLGAATGLRARDRRGGCTSSASARGTPAPGGRVAPGYATTARRRCSPVPLPLALEPPAEGNHRLMAQGLTSERRV